PLGERKWFQMVGPWSDGGSGSRHPAAMGAWEYERKWERALRERKGRQVRSQERLRRPAQACFLVPSRKKGVAAKGRAVRHSTVTQARWDFRSGDRSSGLQAERSSTGFRGKGLDHGVRVPSRDRPPDEIVKSRFWMSLSQPLARSVAPWVVRFAKSQT